MTKRAVLFSAFLIISIQAIDAQKNSELHLINGSIIHGNILENHSDSIIKIRDKCDNVLVFKQSDVKTIKLITKSKQSEFESAPFQVSINTGIVAFGGNYSTGGSLLISGTYRFKDRFFAGISTGVEHLEIPLLPVAAEFQADLYKRNTTPFVYVRSGYGFKLISNETSTEYIAEYKGGPMFGAGIGIKKCFSSEFAMTFSIGYRHQQTFELRDYLFNDWWWNSDYERQYFLNRTAFRVAFVF